MNTATAVSRRIEALNISVNVLARRLNVRPREFRYFLARKKGMSYEKLFELFELLGLSYGIRGEETASIPPQDIHKLVAEVFERKRYVRNRLAYMLEIHPTTLWRFLSGTTQIGLKHLEHLTGVCGIDILPYGTPTCPSRVTPVLNATAHEQQP